MSNRQSVQQFNDRCANFLAIFHAMSRRHVRETIAVLDNPNYQLGDYDKCRERHNQETLRLNTLERASDRRYYRSMAIHA